MRIYVSCVSIYECFRVFCASVGMSWMGRVLNRSVSPAQPHSILPMWPDSVQTVADES